LILAKLNIN